MRHHRCLVFAHSSIEGAHSRLALAFAIGLDPLIERGIRVAERAKHDEQDGDEHDRTGDGPHPQRKATRRRDDLHRPFVSQGRRKRFCLTATAKRRRRDQRSDIRRRVGRERGVELEKCVASGVRVAFGRVIARVLQAIARGLKFRERVRLIEVDELALPRFADERLPGQNRGAYERTKRGFHRAPRFDQVGGEIFGAMRSVESGHRGARRVELEARAPLCLGRHRTIRRSPATALPRMKLSASLVGIRIPVCRNPCCDTPLMNSSIECAGFPR